MCTKHETRNRLFYYTRHIVSSTNKKQPCLVREPLFPQIYYIKTCPLIRCIANRNRFFLFRARFTFIDSCVRRAYAYPSRCDCTLKHIDVDLCDCTLQWSELVLYTGWILTQTACCLPSTLCTHSMVCCGMPASSSSS